MTVCHPIRVALLVDDDETVLKGFRRAFVREGKRVVAAATSDHARRLAAQESPDFAVVDLMIGGDWGIRLVEDLKAALPELTIAVVSGYMGVTAAVDAIAAGASYVFVKPVTGSEIISRVENGVGQYSPPRLPSLARVEWEHLMRALAECGGNKSEAARRLGTTRQGLQARLKKPVPKD